MPKKSQQQDSVLTIVLIVFSIFLWCYLFRLFVNGSAPLTGDAYPYFGHVSNYLASITRGVYPLGNFNEFLLRRIGEFNPFYWFILIFNKCGFSFTESHRLFLTGYFFLGIYGFYLLSQRIFRDQRASLVAALILLFSSLGANIFESYLILLVVPYLWFAYFLVAFVQKPCKAFFLGATFALMVINITYIPFYFYTILAALFISFSIVNLFQMKDLFRKDVRNPAVGGACSLRDFVKQNKIFTVICIFLFIVSLIPGILWFQETSHGETLVSGRHEGSQASNVFTVSSEKVNEGGINSYYLFNRQIINLDRIDLKDFYIPLFAFLMLSAGIWGRTNKKLVILFIFLYIIFLIGQANASLLHGFLYSHTALFKYFRNIQFFLWLAILPGLILFVVEQMQIFIAECQERLINRTWMTGWVVFVHVGAAVLYGCFGSTHLGTYASILGSLGWMLGLIWSVGTPRTGALLLWMAIVLQPFHVYSHIATVHIPVNQDPHYTSYKIQLPSVETARKHLNSNENIETKKSQKKWPYFSTRWHYDLISSADYYIVDRYFGATFIAYDSVERVGEKMDTKQINRSLGYFKNVAYVHSNDVYEGQRPFLNKAQILTSQDNTEILKTDINDVIIRTKFDKPKFLVRAHTYHSQWNVFIDGKKEPLLRTNMAFQGVWVPAGEHIIHWSFAQPWRYGLAYFLIGLYVVVLGWVVWLCFRLRKSM